MALAIRLNKHLSGIALGIVRFRAARLLMVRFNEKIALLVQLHFASFRLCFLCSTPLITGTSAHASARYVSSSGCIIVCSVMGGGCNGAYEIVINTCQDHLLFIFV